MILTYSFSLLVVMHHVGFGLVVGQYYSDLYSMLRYRCGEIDYLLFDNGANGSHIINCVFKDRKRKCIEVFLLYFYCAC